MLFAEMHCGDCHMHALEIFMQKSQSSTVSNIQIRDTGSNICNLTLLKVSFAKCGLSLTFIQTF